MRELVEQGVGVVRGAERKGEREVVRQGVGEVEQGVGEVRGGNLWSNVQVR